MKKPQDKPATRLAQAIPAKLKQPGVQVVVSKQAAQNLTHKAPPKRK